MCFCSTPNDEKTISIADRQGRKQTQNLSLLLVACEQRWCKAKIRWGVEGCQGIKGLSISLYKNIFLYVLKSLFHFQGTNFRLTSSFPLLIQFWISLIAVSENKIAIMFFYSVSECITVVTGSELTMQANSPPRLVGASRPVLIISLMWQSSGYLLRIVGQQRECFSCWLTSGRDDTSVGGGAGLVPRHIHKELNPLTSNLAIWQSYKASCARPG